METKGKMRTPYIISKIKGKFVVQNPHPDALEWECFDTLEEAKKGLEKKRKEYFEHKNKK
jgi:hypothetical protein